jgi:hypothetical protein
LWGDALTWKILTSENNFIIFRSTVRPFTTVYCNLCAELLGGEKLDENRPKMYSVIKSRDDMTEWSNQIITQSKDVATPQDSIVAVFNPEDLVGKINLMDKDKDGQQVCAQIVRLLQDHEGKI